MKEGMDLVGSSAPFAQRARSEGEVGERECRILRLCAAVRHTSVPENSPEGTAATAQWSSEESHFRIGPPQATLLQRLPH